LQPQSFFDRVPDEVVDLQIEALLLSSPEGVSRVALKRLTPKDFDLDAAVGRLQAFWKDRGAHVVETPEGWRAKPLRLQGSKPVHRRTLTDQAVETLAAVMLHQPISTRALEAVRGVKVSKSMMESLQSDGRIVGERRTVGSGSGIEWYVTPELMDDLGIASLADLPDPEESEELGFTGRDTPL
jgi:segregation and condensation protein B